MTGRDWNPRLSADGVHYCSPACGGGKYCRKDWYDAAVAQAHRLAEELGDGWEPHVWENLGWHWCARKGCCAVHPNVDKHQPFIPGEGWPIINYTVYLNLPGKQLITRVEVATDALGFAVQEARTTMAQMHNALVELLEETS